MGKKGISGDVAYSGHAHGREQGLGNRLSLLGGGGWGIDHL